MSESAALTGGGGGILALFNSAFVYQTQKQVVIHDRKLACIYFSLLLLVFVWVVGFQILWGNEHFQLFDVTGSARVLQNLYIS
jgi:hypothetical protein